MKVVASKRYRVEGEIGRFQFLLYWLQAESGEAIVQSEGWFARCGAREWYKTTGYREEAIFLEASQRAVYQHRAGKSKRSKNRRSRWNQAVTDAKSDTIK